MAPRSLLRQITYTRKTDVRNAMKDGEFEQFTTLTDGCVDEISV